MTTRVVPRDRLGGTEGNELLTSATGVLLTALLVAEGVTIVWLGGLLTEHMFVGLVLIGPIVLKLASTGYRFARYYTHAPRYRSKGPPALPLRLLAPLLVATTVLIFASGVALLLLGHRSSILLNIHKVSFFVWGACFGVHFLWHLPTVLRAVAPSVRPRVSGGPLRGMLVATSIGAGAVLAVALLSLVESWHRGPFG